MNRKAVLALIVAVFSCFCGYGQKIKYKDLIVLLNARQFDEAEPFLKKYLKENDDNPNAYLFMGMIYQEKSSKLDVLKQTELLVSQIDSAVYFYQKASAGITEKELSRNEDNYQMYNRRDLRTGKFGIKLSDVQLDLESRMKLKDRAKMITSMKASFVLAHQRYERTRTLFTALSASYRGNREFLLQGDEKTHAELTAIAQSYDSCLMAFNDYKSLLQQLGKTTYNQDLHPEDIRDFKKDGLSDADFYQDDLKIWDYKRWAVTSIETMEKEIAPLRDQLVAIDVEINKLQQQIKKDSVSVRPAMAGIRSKMNLPGLLKIDPHPMPLWLFEIKYAELDYGSLIVENRSSRDSASIAVQLTALQKELSVLRRIDSLTTGMEPAKIDEEAVNYKHFVATAFGTPAVMKSLIKTTHEFSTREAAKKEALIKQRTERMQWIIAGSDSIPLFTEIAPASRYRPLVIIPDAYTMGIAFRDSVAHGYFYAITPSRTAELKSAFAIDSTVFTRRSLPFTKGLSTQDDKGHVYFVAIYSEAKVKDRYPITISKIYQTDGLSWHLNMNLEQLPVELLYSAETSEVTVKTRNAAGELIPVVLDKNGKPVK